MATVEDREVGSLSESMNCAGINYWKWWCAKPQMAGVRPNGLAEAYKIDIDSERHRRAWLFL